MRVTFYCQGQTSGVKDKSIRFKEGKEKPFKESKNQSEQSFCEISKEKAENTETNLKKHGLQLGLLVFLQLIDS